MHKLPKQRVVLLGMGHTHAHIAKMWRMGPIPRTELVCISDSWVASYSGMLPGVLAGNYERDQMNIDLVRFCKSAGALLIQDTVKNIDAQTKSIEFEDRPPLSFDLLSIGIGSRPKIPDNLCASKEIIPIKPMQTFMTRLQSAVDALKNQGLQTVRACVVGGGVGGMEISFCLLPFLKKSFDEVEISVATSGDAVAPGLAASTQKKVEKAFDAKQIHVLRNRRVENVQDKTIFFSDGSTQEFDIILWATSAVAPPLFSDLSFAKDDKGFLQTRSTLQLVESDEIFAVGDSGTLVENSTPKAGVFAVRQGPYLWQNIQRSLRGQGLVHYKPQTDFLKLVNTGDNRAIAEYRGFSFWASWAWKLKDRIDSKFMSMYQDYRPAMMAAPEPDENEMRCLGCGGKVGGSILSRALAKLDIHQSEDVIIGLDNPDDCAVVKSKSDSVVATTDFFASPVDDPYITGRIAALNALSDVFVMGARPHSALAIITLPYGREKNQEELLFQILSGSLFEFDRCGTSLVGGHTIEGPQLTVGYTILAEPATEARFAKSDLKAGDELVLTKPLGSGSALAAHMQAECNQATYQELMEIITQSNLEATQIARSHQVRAMTDVTGFGLAGHLLEMLSPSKLDAELFSQSIPLIDQVDQLFEKGIESTLAPANRDAESKISVSEKLRRTASYKALFDPQTCGGVLLGVEPNAVEPLLHDLRTAGFEKSCVIGKVSEGSGSSRITIQE